MCVAHQMLMLKDGSRAPNSGGAVWAGAVDAAGRVPTGWQPMAAPVVVPWPDPTPENYCPNYSPALVVVDGAAGGGGGTLHMLEVSTAYVGAVCCAFYNATLL